LSPTRWTSHAARFNGIDATSEADYDAAMREMIAIVNRDVPLLTFRQAALEVVIGKDIGN